MKYQIRLLLFIVFSSSVILSQSISASPANSTTVGNSWKCNPGYKKQGQQCNRIFLPPNARLNGMHWVCNSGYKRQGNQCNPISQKSIRQRNNISSKSSSSDGSLRRAMYLYEKKQYSKALPIFHKVAKEGKSQKGVKIAEEAIGFIYSFGLGTTAKNKKLGLAWYMKLAKKGHARAQYSVGNAYRYGDGTLKDHKKSAYWYQLSSDQGYAKAQRILGLLYLLGEGVLRDHRKSTALFRKSAIQGDYQAQYYLGKNFCVGVGVQKNLYACSKWIKKAYENEHPGAAEVWDEYKLWKYQNN